MSYLKIKKSFSYRDLLYKVLVFAGTVALIVYFLPREGKFSYQFDLNKPWKYGQLMATFDFPIYKDEAVVKKEQDSLLASFQPYYRLNKTVEKDAVRKLKENYKKHLNQIVPSVGYLHHLEKTLKEIYAKGIASTEDIGQIKKDSVTFIMVVEDKLANQQLAGNVYSVKEAYEYLLSADTIHY